MLYLPAPGSPGPPAQEDKKESSDSEEDTLDAFMSNLVIITCLPTEINADLCVLPSVYNSDFVTFFQEKDAKEQGVSSALKLDNNPKSSKQVSIQIRLLKISSGFFS